MIRSPWRFLAVACALTAAKLMAYAALAHGHLGRAMCQWDCGWYLAIAVHGYDRAAHSVGGHMQANWAFFPLYPLLLRVLGALAQSPLPFTGLVFSTACLIAFAVIGQRYRQATRRAASPWLWLLLLTAWPYGFYFHTVYTEALYALLALAAMLALTEGRPLMAGIAAALLGATRPTGILMAAWIGVRGLLARGAGQRRRTLLAACIGCLGLAAFMLLLWRATGDPLAFVHIQAGWRHHAGNPMTVLWSALAAAGGAHRGLAYDAAWALLGLGAALWLAVRRRGIEAWLCGATVLAALLSGTVWSMPRFVACNPAFLLAAADLLEAVPGRLPKAALLSIGVVAECALVVLWMRGSALLT